MNGITGARRGERVLLCPGPVMLTPGVRAALADTTLGHRDAEFSALMRHLQGSARRLFGASTAHTVLFLGGPATAAIEATFASLLAPDAHVLVPVNGAFGARLAEILAVHRIAHTVIDFGFAQPYDLARIEAALDAQGTQRPTVLATTHHETSAGLLNPVTRLGELAQRHGLR